MPDRYYKKNSVLPISTWLKAWLQTKVSTNVNIIPQLLMVQSESSVCPKLAVGYHANLPLCESNINDKCDENETKAKTMWTCPILAKLMLYHYVSGVKVKNMTWSLKVKVRVHILSWTIIMRKTNSNLLLIHFKHSIHFIYH